jgi:hypothetical protein
MQENVALMCLDKNFLTAENIALYTLSDILKECKDLFNQFYLDMQDVGKDIKAYTELNGRTDSNMIDALNAMYERDMTKAKLIEHMNSKELSL